MRTNVEERRAGAGQLLVIEDEPKLATLLSRTLSATGYSVTCVQEGAPGLRLAREGTFALVLLDLLLPDVDGFAVLDELLGERPDQQVIVLSALSDVGSKVRCLEFGAADFIAKPFELPELIARIRRCVRTAQSGATRFLAVGGLTLDLQRRCIAVAEGSSIPLSTREFLLLEYLMRKPGDVCGRTELLEHVWGYTFDPGTNVVEVCVGRLRHKLGRDFIETVRNVGYCFVGT